MKIFERELTISEIVNIRKGATPISYTVCESRRSDCFFYVTAGSADYTFGDKVVTVEKGNVVFLAHKSKYDISVKTSDYSYIYIDFFFTKSDNTSLENQVFSNAELHVLETAFTKLNHLWNIGNFADKILCRSILYRIYAEVTKCALYSYVSSEKRETLKASVDMMTERYSDASFSVMELSGICNMSQVHFRRIFKQIYHMSPIQFLTMLRIEKAKELLGATKMPIHQVSEKCGFASAYYFSKRFKENTGMRPGEYRSMK